MQVNEIKPGLKGRAAAVAGRKDLASAYGNKGVDVLSSMTLMTLLEQACMDALKGAPGPGPDVRGLAHGDGPSGAHAGGVLQSPPRRS